jgi:hypothetical protein
MKALNDECGFLCYRTERPPKKVDKEREFNSFNDLQSSSTTEYKAAFIQNIIQMQKE